MQKIASPIEAPAGFPQCDPRLSERANRHGSSAVRDLLDQAKRPGMISLAGGLPDETLFPLSLIHI